VTTSWNVDGRFVDAAIYPVPYKGLFFCETLLAFRKALTIIIILAVLWPHEAFNEVVMPLLPGSGSVTVPSRRLSWPQQQEKQ